MANRTKRTPKALKKFFDELMDGASLTEAADAAGIGRRTVYDWMENDPEFEAKVAVANDIGAESSLIPVATKHAKDGWEEPVFHKGEEVGTITRYDHNLLWKLILAKSKRYRTPLRVESEISIVEDLGEKMRKAEERVKSIKGR